MAFLISNFADFFQNHTSEKLKLDHVTKRYQLGHQGLKFFQCFVRTLFLSAKMGLQFRNPNALPPFHVNPSTMNLPNPETSH